MERSYEERVMKYLGQVPEKECPPKLSEELCAKAKAGEPIPPQYRQSKENDHVFYEVQHLDLTDDQVDRLLRLQQAEDTQTIRKNVHFLYLLAIVNLIAAAVIAFLLFVPIE